MEIHKAKKWSRKSPCDGVHLEQMQDIVNLQRSSKIIAQMGWVPMS